MQRNLKQNLFFILITFLLIIMILSNPLNASKNIKNQKNSDSLSLIGQTSWVTTQPSFTLQVKISNLVNPKSLSLDAFVYPKLENRSAFAATINNKVPGDPIWVWSHIVANLKPNKTNIYTISIPLGIATSVENSLNLNNYGGPGVYPVIIDLGNSSSGKRISQLTTHLIYVGNSKINPKLDFSWILPQSSKVVKGSIAATSIRNLTSESLLLANNPTVPVNLAPVPQTLQALSNSGNSGKTVLRLLKKDSQIDPILSQSYVPINEQNLENSKLGPDIGKQISLGSYVIHSTLGISPTPSIWNLTHPANQKSLIELKRLGFKYLVIKRNSLTPFPNKSNVTLANPFKLSLGPHSPDMISTISDSGLSQHFQNSPGQVLRAHQFLADLAEIYFDDPSVLRGTVVSTPSKWNPSTSFLNVVLPSLAKSPIINTVSLKTFFHTVPLATNSFNKPLVTKINSRYHKGILPTKKIKKATQELKSFNDISTPQSNNIYLQELLANVEKIGLSYQARLSLIGLFQRTIKNQISSIKLTNNKLITLTSKNGRIPITVSSNLNFPIKVLLRLKSNKLLFPNGSSRFLDLKHQNTTVIFSVKARTPGSFPVKVLLTSADKNLTIDKGEFIIHSTATSIEGILLTIGAGGFLVVWWIKDLFKGKKGRNKRLLLNTSNTSQKEL